VIEDVTRRDCNIGYFNQNNFLRSYWSTTFQFPGRGRKEGRNDSGAGNPVFNPESMTALLKAAESESPGFGMKFGKRRYDM